MVVVILENVFALPYFIKHILNIFYLKQFLRQQNRVSIFFKKFKSITVSGFMENMPFPVSINCAYPELLSLGNHFADGLNTNMADVPDNAPEREY